jgi:ISTde2, transposase
MDTVYSGKKKSTVALLVLTERKTRNENIIMVPDRRAETTVQAINALERKLGAEKFGIIYKSITVDNGSEFALADQLEQSCITGDKRTKVYYCHPYSSWERGSNENVNGMIRRRHPKGTDFSKVTAEEIAATENWINSYPRKIFGYKSAGTMFRECLRELGLTA